MRTTLGRTAAAMVAGIALATGVVAVASPAAATTPTSTSTTTTTSTSTTTTTTTTTTVPLVARVQNPKTATPERGTQVQVAETLPPPVTTTTLPETGLPANSGTGRRIVYRKTWPMRVWLVEADGTVAKTHLVSGRATWNQPPPNDLTSGRTPDLVHLKYYSPAPAYYQIPRNFGFSQSTCNITKPHICWRYMVRFTQGPDRDNIGFHEIPTNRNTGGKLQTESQLGLALSNGCIRQRSGDAEFLYRWAHVGTKVVVLP